MKLLLQSDWQADNMTAPVKQAIEQLKWKNGYTTIDSISATFNWLQLQRDLTYIDYTPVGTVEFVKAFAEKIGITLPDPIHAIELLDLESRWYHKDMYREACVRSHKYSATMFPFFVKPMWELKKFTGFVARSDKDFDLYPDVDWSTTKLFCTQVLENIVSEWRCYVLNGKVFACVNYSGDPLRFPDASEIEKMRIVYGSTSSYSLDIAVCQYNYKYLTQFIEINDAYALGYYGGDVELYTKMLNERWKQIVLQK